MVKKKKFQLILVDSYKFPLVPINSHNSNGKFPIWYFPQISIAIYVYFVFSRVWAGQRESTMYVVGRGLNSPTGSGVLCACA